MTAEPAIDLVTGQSPEPATRQSPGSGTRQSPGSGTRQAAEPPAYGLGELPANPLAEGLERTRRAPAGVLCVFGASGDLTARKLLPALERLNRRRLLPAAFAVVGVARTDMDDEGFRDLMTASVPAAGPGWDEIVKHSRYIAGDYTDPATFDRLAGEMADLDQELGTGGNRTYYLATVPSVWSSRRWRRPSATSGSTSRALLGRQCAS